jgi:hypothetical protein
MVRSAFPMSPILYWPLLLFVCGYALLRGGRDERLVALISLVATIVSIAVRPLHERYFSVNSGELIVDVLVLGAFVAVALVSDRFWPLWVAGLQLITSFGHFLKAVEPDLLPHAYAASVRFWSYPLLLILLIGAWRAHRRRQRQTEALEPAPS